MSQLTQKEKSRLLDSLVDDLTLDSNYVFLSKYTAWPDDDAPPDTDYSVDGIRDARREALVGKKISATQVRRMFRRIDWTANTVYDTYRNDDEALEDKDFYVLTSSRHVYKCLFNADDAPSTVAPSLTTTSTFTTADGYVWKYMFTVPQDDMDTFSTATRFPFSSNVTIETAAVPGTIDVITIDNSGNNWVIYDTGTLLGVVSNNQYQVAANSVAVNSHYVNSSFYVVSGGGAGYLSEIVSYVSNSTGNYVTTTGADANVAFGALYIIGPTVSVTGDGSGAKAYATVNTTTATIDSVNVVSPGNSYSWAEASIYANTGASNTAAVLTPIISPMRGHGYDPKHELYSSEVTVSVNFEAADAPLVSYRIAGVLREPTYANGQSFSEADYTAYWSANTALFIGVTVPPSSGETVTGQTSGATGTVVTANTTYVIVGDVTGTFVEDEVVISSGDSSSIITVSGINTPQINVSSGVVTFFEHFEPVLRANTSSERVRLTVRT